MSLWLPHSSSSSSRGNDMSSYRYSLATDPSASSLWKDDTRFPPHLITIIGHLKVPPNDNCVQEGWKNKDKLSETRKYCVIWRMLLFVYLSSSGRGAAVISATSSSFVFLFCFFHRKPAENSGTHYGHSRFSVVKHEWLNLWNQYWRGYKRQVCLFKMIWPQKNQTCLSLEYANTTLCFAVLGINSLNIY